MSRHGGCGKEGGLRLYQRLVAVFAVTFIGIGVALLVVSAARGGSAFGFLLGALFIALGTARLYLLRARR